MTLSEELSRINSLFIDTAPVIYYIEAHPQRQAYQHVAKRFSREEFDTNIKKNSHSWRFWSNHYSYSQCFRRVFMIFGCGGLVGLYFSVARLVWK